MAVILETRNLTKRFGGLTAVDVVNLRLDEGELRCIIGPNGCGKTTLFNLISGFYKPSEGQVVYNGQDITGKPVFLHQRDAHDAFVGIMRELRPRLPGGVAHCFTGDERELRDYLALDLSIGITGWICDERRGHHLRDLVRLIPADRLMIETDAPYLLPRDLTPKPQGRRNEPKYLPHILATVAACRGEAPEAVAAATTRNALRFFGFEK